MRDEAEEDERHERNQKEKRRTGDGRSRRRETGKEKVDAVRGLPTGDEEIERQEKRERWQRSAAGR